MSIYAKLNEDHGRLISDWEPASEKLKGAPREHADLVVKGLRIIFASAALPNNTFYPGYTAKEVWAKVIGKTPVVDLTPETAAKKRADAISAALLELKK